MSNEVCLNELENSAYVIVEENRILDLSDSFQEIVEYTRKSMLNKDITQLFRERLRLTYDIEKLEEGVRAECFLFNKSLKAVLGTISFLEWNGKKIFLFERKERFDVIDQLQVMEQLCRSKEAGVAIYTVSPEIILVGANQLYLDFLDRPFNQKETTIGKSIQYFMTGWIGSSSEKIWRDLLETGEGFQSDEYKYDRFERGDTYWRTMLIPIFADKVIKYVIEITEDITQTVLTRKQLEEQARIIKAQNEELQKTLAMKDEFFTMISHEFKTPLNVINAAVQAIEGLCGAELSSTSKKFIGKIRQNTFRQLRLINNMLDYTKLNAGKLKLNKKNLDMVFLTQSIIQSVELYARQKGVKIKFQSEFKEKMMGMDEEKYERILLNLLSNAIKFTPKGKTICVRLSDKERRLCIEVKDEGIGIPKEKQNVIFRRFGQVQSDLSRQAEGTGIGLSLVKMLVKALGGVILVTSEEGKGSTFSMLFPAHRVRERSITDLPLQNSNQRLTEAVKIEFCDIYL